MRRVSVGELQALHPEGVTYICAFSTPDLSGALGRLDLRFSVSWPLGKLLVTQDRLVFSLGFGLSRLVRPWLLDQADVEFFDSWGRTVWLTRGNRSDWWIWTFDAAQLRAQLQSLGYKSRASGAGD